MIVYHNYFTAIRVHLPLTTATYTANMPNNFLFINHHSPRPPASTVPIRHNCKQKSSNEASPQLQHFPAYSLFQFLTFLGEFTISTTTYPGRHIHCFKLPPFPGIFTVSNSNISREIHCSNYKNNSQGTTAALLSPTLLH